MIAYGVLALNPLLRAIVGVVLIGAAPLASAFFVRASNPDWRAVFDAAASDHLFETALILGASATVAIFAAFLTFTLFNYAFDQRKRTFYDLEERIGSGGMGEVWRGRHQTLARSTAIKLIREDRIKGVDADHARRVLLRFERHRRLDRPGHQRAARGPAGHGCQSPRQTGGRQGRARPGGAQEHGEHEPRDHGHPHGD